MKKVSVLILSFIMVATAVILPSCAQEAEASDFTGILTVANDQKIIVSNAQDTKEFVTDNSTKYDMSGESSFCMNDIVKVTYRQKGNKLVAEDMTLKKHVHKDMEFSGVITNSTDKTLTVANNSLTVTFSYDSKTSVTGKLTKGSKVRVVYVGDLSEFPKATKITVTKEAKEKPETLKVNGVVSEFTDRTLLLGIDSAHSQKFTLDKNTKITGVAKELKVGDSVNVTYKNTEDKEPLVTEINIVKEAAPEVITINGVIKSVGQTAISIKTSNKSYTFTVDENTKYKGAKPAVGCEAEVTYSKVKDKLVASTIYCQKREEPKPELKPEPKPTPPEPTPPTPVEPTNAEGSLRVWGVNGENACIVDTESARLTLAYDPNSLEIPDRYMPQADDNVRIQYMADTSTLKKIELISRPEHSVTAEGTLTAWGVNGENKCTVDIQGSDEIELTYTPSDLEIAIGYMPQAEDYVSITYTGSVLNRIDLINRPKKEEEKKDSDDEKSKDDEKSTDALIKAEKVTYVSGDKKTCKIQLENDEVIELKLDKDTSIASGYSPQDGDLVTVVYDKNTMLLKNIQLVERPANTESEVEQHEIDETDAAPTEEPQDE